MLFLSYYPPTISKELKAFIFNLLFIKNRTETHKNCISNWNKFEYIVFVCNIVIGTYIIDLYGKNKDIFFNKSG